MQRFSKETKEFLGAVGDAKKILTMIPPSADRMTPGEILVFRYYLGSGAGSRGQRVCLVVKSRRGDGIFAGKDGLLVSCFKLNGNSEDVVDAIIDNLYKKRRRASYYGKIKESLVKLLGVDSYRTYKLTQMKDIFKVSLGR
jgi:hypothetical protein